MGRIGQIPWNKGKKLPYIAHPKALGRKAWNEGISTSAIGRVRPKRMIECVWLWCSKVSIVPVNKVKKYCSYSCRSRANAKRHWFGKESYYKNLHKWVAEKFGKPDTCELCGRSGLYGRYIHWANKTGRYLKERSDWIRLCVKCHYEYDRQLAGSVSNVV